MCSGVGVSGSPSGLEDLLPMAVGVVRVCRSVWLMKPSHVHSSRDPWTSGSFIDIMGHGSRLSGARKGFCFPWCLWCLCQPGSA